jgi:hypothetical protein
MVSALSREGVTMEEHTAIAVIGHATLSENTVLPEVPGSDVESLSAAWAVSHPSAHCRPFPFKRVKLSKNPGFPTNLVTPKNSEIAL